VRPRTRQRLLRWGIVAAASVVAILLVLIGLGYLVLPSNSPADVTITAVHWTVLQGTTSSGQGWFGPSEFNYTDNGWPAQVTPGGSIAIPWSFSMYDTTNRTIYAILVGAPFSLRYCSPSLPILTGATDDGFVSVAVNVPSQGGLSAALSITVETR